MTSRTIDEVTGIKCLANERRESGGQSRGKEERIKNIKYWQKGSQNLHISKKSIIFAENFERA